MQLRPYQEDLVNDIRNSLRRGNKSVCAVLGCGGGKSVIIADIIKKATDRQRSVLLLVHRKELLEQLKNSVYIIGEANPWTCDVEMVQTMSRKISKHKENHILNYDLIITDEAHHSTAQTYLKIYDRYPEAVKLGFTATPVRLNRGGLGGVYKDLITSVSTKWLIENHYLSPYKYYSIKLADTSSLHTKNGDFDKSEVAELMENTYIYGNTVEQWEKLAKGKRTIVYCSSVKSAEETAQAFKNAGYTASAISGNTPKKERDLAMNKFRAGDITVLTNCDLFGEGLDVPDCECVVLLRPTQSLSLYIQQSMRSMRYKEGKTALILDFVMNVYRHGLPDDERQWSLETKKKQETIVKIRECPNCFAVYPPTMGQCPFCGFRATKEIRTVNRKTINVDLQEIKRQEIIKNTELKDAVLKTWDEVVEFQKLHGYKFGWCIHYAGDHKIPIPKKYNYMRHKYIK